MVLKFSAGTLGFLKMRRSVSSKSPLEFIQIHSKLYISDIPGTLTFFTSCAFDIY